MLALQIVFGTGDELGAITLSANKHFVSAAAAQVSQSSHFSFHPSCSFFMTAITELFELPGCLLTCFIDWLELDVR